ncbi:HIT domain-containing protein [Candidatus Mcinerneyibacteriota bacterium]|nr:HIT domain-containing protein [Candidatus Mcinerneyibacteriota bacterium]
MSLYRKHLYPPDKGDYIRKRRSVKAREEKCILCAVRDGDPDVAKLDVYRENGFIVTVNLYPYNPGHIMIFPERHITDLRELTPEEEVAFIRIRNKSLDIIEGLYHCEGFNIGFNIGKASGASIEHLHLHVVPRDRGELGFMDIIGGAKIYIENPAETVKKLRKAFHA